MENDSLRIELLPGKGSDVIQFLYKPQNVDFMWRSVPGLRPRGSVVVSANPKNAFLDFYPGGWQEVMPNFGDPCEYKGAALGLHDEVSLLPWAATVAKDEPDCVSVALEVRCLRTPFRLRKVLTLRLGCELEIHETVINESEETMDFTWGHHPAIGSPFLDESCRVIVPQCRVKTQERYVSPNSRLEQNQDSAWPFVQGRHGEMVDLSRIPPKSAHSHDMSYLYGFEQGWYVLFSESRKLGFSMSWDSTLFKYLWFWQVHGGWHGYPWYGTSYNIGLEPCTSYPPTLAGAIANGTQVKLDPGESLETALHVSAVDDLDEFLSSKASVASARH